MIRLTEQTRRDRVLESFDARMDQLGNMNDGLGQLIGLDLLSNAIRREKRNVEQVIDARATDRAMGLSIPAALASIAVGVAVGAVGIGIVAGAAAILGGAFYRKNLTERLMDRNRHYFSELSERLSGINLVSLFGCALGMKEIMPKRYMLRPFPQLRQLFHDVVVQHRATRRANPDVFPSNKQ